MILILILKFDLLFFPARLRRCAGNYSLWGSGAPLMNKVYLDSSKRIANPSAAEVADGRPTVFETWVHRYPDSNHPAKPK